MRSCTIYVHKLTICREKEYTVHISFTLIFRVTFINNLSPGACMKTTGRKFADRMASPMILAQRKYTVWDIVTLSFRSAPWSAGILTLLKIGKGFQHSPSLHGVPCRYGAGGCRRHHPHRLKCLRLSFTASYFCAYVDKSHDKHIKNQPPQNPPNPVHLLTPLRVYAVIARLFGSLFRHFIRHTITRGHTERLRLYRTKHACADEMNFQHIVLAEFAGIAGLRQEFCRDEMAEMRPSARVGFVRYSLNACKLKTPLRRFVMPRGAHSHLVELVCYWISRPALTKPLKVVAMSMPAVTEAENTIIRHVCAVTGIESPVVILFSVAPIATRPVCRP